MGDTLANETEGPPVEGMLILFIFIFTLHFCPLFSLLLNVETIFFFQFSKVDLNIIIATVYTDKNKGQKIVHILVYNV